MQVKSIISLRIHTNVIKIEQMQIIYTKLRTGGMREMGLQSGNTEKVLTVFVMF